ncbi:MAG: hypothetical protein ACE5EH_04115 [Gammaproteobacteria bacterium]
MLDAPLPIRVGQEMPVTYEFIFSKKLPVTKVKLFQYATEDRRPANGYVIDVDSDGDGQYEKSVVNERRGNGGEWHEYQIVPAIYARALRFRTTEYANVNGPNYGAAAVGEIEIYTDAKQENKPLLELMEQQRVVEVVSGARELDELIDELIDENVDIVGDGFLRGLFGSMWFFWSPGSEYSESKNVQKVELLKKLNINRYWLYPGVYINYDIGQNYVKLPTNPDYLYFINRKYEHSLELGDKQYKILPFPSEILQGYRENILSKFISNLHKYNIKVIANEPLLPFGLTEWDFPRVANSEIYPSVLCSSFVQQASSQLYLEFMNAGVDGIALGGDEFFYYSSKTSEAAHPKLCVDDNNKIREICKPLCSEVFKDIYGLDIPELQKPFNPNIAKYNAFVYQRLAMLFQGYADIMKAKNPDAIITSLFRSGEENRPAYGIAYDVMGVSGSVIEMSSNPYWSKDSYLGHYFFANETKKLIGASKERKAVITLQVSPGFDKNGYEDPIMIYGPAFSGLMHGLQGVNFYKQDYLFAGGYHDPGPWVEKFFNLTVLLDKLMLREYETPQTVALLYSRASDDWWQLSNPHDPIEASKAIVTQNAVMEVLFRNGIPFDLYYLDQPSMLNNLGDYDLIILPFPYAISRESFEKIKYAKSIGSKIISLNRKGEVDQAGMAYEKPLFSNIDYIEHLEIVLKNENYESFSQKIMQVLNSMDLDYPMKLNTYSQDVECSIRSNYKNNNKLLFCQNWEQKAVEFSVSVNLLLGKYSLSVVTLEHASPATIDDKAILTNKDFEKFQLSLAEGEAKILFIESLDNLEQKKKAPVLLAPKLMQ